MSKVSARQKVKAARARLDAERIAREARVDKAAEQYYKQANAITKADERLAKAHESHQDAVEQAQDEQATAIVAMLDEGETPTSVAQLLDLSKSDIAAAKKRHESRSTDRSVTAVSIPAPQAAADATGRRTAEDAGPVDRVVAS